MKVVAGGAIVNFETEVIEFNKAESAEILLGPRSEATFDLVANVTAGSPDELFLVLGLEFMQEVNGTMYPLKNGAYKPNRRDTRSNSSSRTKHGFSNSVSD